ncbi:MAG: flagellar protein FliT [Methylococcaceae bacterium]|nr:flagellar protein FliT [Methylococcaceae bacterium]
MTKAIRGSFYGIFSFTEEIQKKISEGDWEDLSDLLKQRQEALEYFFTDSVSGMCRADVISMIEKIQVEDALSLRVLQAQKQTMEKQYLSLKQGRKSVKAYQGD